MTIGTYPLLTPTPIILNPIAYSENPNFYDILIEDDEEEDGDVTLVTDNKTPKGIVNLAGNTIMDAKVTTESSRGRQFEARTVHTKSRTA